MPSTSDLIAWDRAHLWHPFTPMKPWIESKDFPIIERGEAEFLFDTDGRQYLDASSSIWCNVHGHHVPALDQAVRDQLEKVAHSTLLGLGNVPSILLAKRLVELTAASGMNLPRVFYSDNGSTAVEVACKIAYQYHQWNPKRQRRVAAAQHPASSKQEPRTANREPRAQAFPQPSRPKTQDPTRYIAFHNSYHGDTLGAVSLGGIPLFHDTFKPLCFHTDFVAPGPHAGAQIEHLLATNPGHYAAIVVEPLIQGAGGMVLHPPGTLRRLRDLCDRHHVLLIADEVLTGFGRTGRMFACEHEGVTPDLLCLSKGLTAGYMPLGATMVRQHIFDAFYADPREGKTFFHGHTYTGHPLACAVALASLDLFATTNLLAHVRTLEPLLDECLAAARKLPFVYDTRRLGLIGAIELRDEQGAPFPYHWRLGGALCRLLRDAQPLGILMRPLADTLVLMPPLAIRPENLVYLCQQVLQCLPHAARIVAEHRANMHKTEPRP